MTSPEMEDWQWQDSSSSEMDEGEAAESSTSAAHEPQTSEPVRQRPRSVRRLSTYSPGGGTHSRLQQAEEIRIGSGQHQSLQRHSRALLILSPVLKQYKSPSYKFVVFAAMSRIHVYGVYDIFIQRPESMNITADEFEYRDT
ncbi:hypothetical protein CVT24_010888 [Panaeolus cyanescens]|uniref:Uncharacterized protein n=1 Tax=Panaeolus cyanescens TaxID=181874 RepID=A0A409YYB6_9AGAR|nr:hypothetical protein CVT24_010888 [Panaeolus cyanescens]